MKLKKQKNADEDDSKDEDEDEEKDEDPEEDNNNDTNSALSLILEKGKWIDKNKDWETPNKTKQTQNTKVWETTNETTAASLFLEDALVEELSTTIRTLMKDVVDNALFKQVNFYRSPQELNHVMGFPPASDKMEKMHTINWKGQHCGQLGVSIFFHPDL